MPIRWRGLIHQINICGENGGRRRRKIIIKETMEEERRKGGRKSTTTIPTMQRTFIDISGSLGIVPHCWEAAPESLEAKLSLCCSFPPLRKRKKTPPPVLSIAVSNARASWSARKREKKA